MDWKTYQKEAFRTNANLGDSRLDKIHMILGMSTEIGELQDAFKKNLAYQKKIDWQNVKEEIGDALWYAAGLAEHEGYNIEDKDYSSNILASSRLYDGDNYSILINLSTTLGILSMNSFTGIGSVEHELQSLIDLLFIFCSKNDIDFWRVVENNIEKLRTRYPEKFTAHNATHRDLDKERVTLDE